MISAKQGAACSNAAVPEKLVTHVDFLELDFG